MYPLFLGFYFHWIKQNINEFGGDQKQITLLGHGTSGAPNAMIHLTNPKTASLLSRLILMSGTIYSTYSYQDLKDINNVSISNELSKILIKKLACSSTQDKYILNCLRQKSVDDLLKAFEYIYEVNLFIHYTCSKLKQRNVFWCVAYRFERNIIAYCTLLPSTLLKLLIVHDFRKTFK